MLIPSIKEVSGIFGIQLPLCSKNIIGVVWTEQKQRGLIDSLMHNYYIPPIVFCLSPSSCFVFSVALLIPKPTAVTQEDDADVRVCIDGKQRLTAINL